MISLRAPSGTPLVVSPPAVCSHHHTCKSEHPASIKYYSVIMKIVLFPEQFKPLNLHWSLVLYHVGCGSALIPDGRSSLLKQI